MDKNVHLERNTLNNSGKKLNGSNKTDNWTRKKAKKTDRKKGNT